MKNRLQFRHCPRIFNDKEEIKAHLVGLFNNDNSPLKPAIPGEPLVLYYQGSADTVTSAVLAIGRLTPDDEYFLIDVGGIEKEIENIEGEIADLSNVDEKLDQEIADRISGDTRLEGIIKRICQSAGFNDDGDDMGKYDEIAHDSTHYIVSSTSLTNADILLDEAIWQNHVDIIHKEATLREDLAVTLERSVSGRTLMSYNLYQGGAEVGQIDIPADRHVSGGELMKNEMDEWILRFTISNENDTPVDSFDVNVENLEDNYTGGPGVVVSGRTIYIDIPGFIGQLDATVSGQSNGVKVEVEEKDGKLIRLDVNAPDFTGMVADGLASAKTYTNEVGAAVLDEAKQYTDDNITSIYRVKGSKTYFEELAEIEDPQVGDVWNVENEYRYTGNTGEVKIYPPGTNFVYVKDEYAAVGRWDPLGGETVDMSLYLTKEEFRQYASASTEALNAKIDEVNERLIILSSTTESFSSSTVSEFERVDGRIDEIVYSGDSYVDVSNEVGDKFVSISGHVITDLRHSTGTSSVALEDVTAPGMYLVDAYLVKQMKEEIERLIAESVNEAKVKAIVANMLKGTEQEIAITMKTTNGTVTTNPASANTLTVSFADDAYFQADLPEGND